MTEAAPAAPGKPGLLLSVARAMASWRTASVTLLAFSSGLPLGLVWIAIPDWLRKSGVDIRVVGLVTLAQAPWTFKFLWSPLMDRYSPPWLGRRRGWIVIAQVALFASTLALAGVGHRPETPMVVAALAFAVAFASATQDIAYDAYTVDVLRPEEQGVAVGAKTAFYWMAFRGAGGLSIALAGAYSWPLVNVCLALLYVPMMVIAGKAPEPHGVPKPPPTLREAVWQPFIGFLGRHRALEILAFVFFYKFSDNLAIALIRPFLIDKGYSDFDRGVALTTLGVVATIVGTFIGGAFTDALGLGRALWLFGALQIFSNIGYVFVARSDMNSLLMYGATAFDSVTTGLGTGAFSVLLLRLTEKRFSATQYALFSSLFGLPRLVAGPVTGFMVDAIGWEAFFWSTLLAGVPGLILLQRFAPLGEREPHIDRQAPLPGRALTSAGIFIRGLAGGMIGCALGGVCVAALAAIKELHSRPGSGFDLVTKLAGLAQPEDMSGWLQVIGLAAFGAVAGLCTAAVFAARSNAGRRAAVEPFDPAA